MQLLASFVGGFLVGLVALFQFTNNAKIEVLSYQQKLENCNTQLTINESKINGMLMNK